MTSAMILRTLVLLSSLSAWAQQAETRKWIRHDPPRFEDFPASEIWHGCGSKCPAGTPMAPKIITAVQRRYRTRIREGVEKGWGVFRDGKEQQGPNFAGKMIVVQWGCGAPCFMMAMVDAQTGDVFLPPLPVDNTFALPLLTIGISPGGNPEVEFRQNSRLMIIDATPQWFKDRHRSYRYYFVWHDDRWTLVHRESLD
jgi:hypothetical protein